VLIALGIQSNLVFLANVVFTLLEVFNPILILTAWHGFFALLESDNTANSLLQKLFNGILSTIYVFGNGIRLVLADIKEDFNRFVSEMRTVLYGLIFAFLYPFITVEGSLTKLDLFNNILDSLVSSIDVGKAANGLKIRIVELLYTIADLFPHSEPKDSSSPLSGITTWGSDIIAIIGKGIADGISFVKKSVIPQIISFLQMIQETIASIKIINFITDFIRTFIKLLKGVVTSGLSGSFGNFAKDLRTILINNFTSLDFSTITGVFTSLLFSTLANIGKQILEYVDNILFGKQFSDGIVAGITKSLSNLDFSSAIAQTIVVSLLLIFRTVILVITTSLNAISSLYKDLYTAFINLVSNMISSFSLFGKALQSLLQLDFIGFISYLTLGIISLFTTVFKFIYDLILTLISFIYNIFAKLDFIQLFANIAKGLASGFWDTIYSSVNGISTGALTDLSNAIKTSLQKEADNASNSLSNVFQKLFKVVVLTFAGVTLNILSLIFQSVNDFIENIEKSIGILLQSINDALNALISGNPAEALNLFLSGIIQSISQFISGTAAILFNLFFNINTVAFMGINTIIDTIFISSTQLQQVLAGIINSAKMQKQIKAVTFILKQLEKSFTDGFLTLLAGVLNILKTFFNKFSIDFEGNLLRLAKYRIPYLLDKFFTINVLSAFRNSYDGFWLRVQFYLSKSVPTVDIAAMVISVIFPKNSANKFDKGLMSQVKKFKTVMTSRLESIYFGSVRMAKTHPHFIAMLETYFNNFILKFADMFPKLSRQIVKMTPFIVDAIRGVMNLAMMVFPTNAPKFKFLMENAIIVPIETIAQKLQD